MRLAKSLYLALLILMSFGFSAHAKADTLVLGLNTTSGVETIGPNETVSQNVAVSTNANVDGFAFYLTDPSGGALTYSITDLSTSAQVFKETFDDTTLDPALTNIAIPEGSKQWLELFLTPVTLEAGDIYAFSVSGANGLTIGTNPTAFTQMGMAASGGLNLGLRVWDPPAPSVTPEPSSLMLLGTGVLAAAGAVRRRFVRNS
jgi:hypothetical protein